MKSKDIIPFNKIVLAGDGACKFFSGKYLVFLRRTHPSYRVNIRYIGTFGFMDRTARDVRGRLIKGHYFE